MDSTILNVDLNNPTPNTVLGSKYLNPDYLFEHGSNFVVKVFKYLFSTDGVATIHNIMFFLSLFFLTIIIYCIVRLFEIRKKEHAHLHHEIHEYAHHQAELAKKKNENTDNARNPRWGQVLNYLFSSNEGDWKLAVIEADAMLEGLLDQLGFDGIGIGEKLKNATVDRFRGLPIAWEVHTIRNKIAHEGSSFYLSNHEAKRVVALYEQIFMEYGYL